MTRLSRRGPLSIAGAALIALALPAAAQAAAFTIKTGEGACTSVGDGLCGTFVDAANATNANADGDQVSVTPGTYAGGADFNNGAVIITGSPGAVVNGSLVFSSPTAVSVLAGLTVIQQGATPAIQATGTAGLAVVDSTVGSQGGDGILITNANNNQIDRSTIFSGNAASPNSAVRVRSDLGSTISLKLSSTVLVGGFAGLGVFTPDNVGSPTVTARHVTAAGSTRGVYVNTGPLGLGTPAVSVFDSITFSPQVVDPVAIPVNTTIAFDAETLTSGNASALFADPANRNFRLRPGSPAINAGNALAGGESTTDIDGQSRAGATTDLGGDEYVNTAPKAAIAVVTKLPRSNEPVQFDGGGSRDQPGGGIASYKWDFGDGVLQTTTTPTVSHTYKGEGPIQAKLTVVDGEGLSSAPALTDLTIVDGTIPAVTITKPKSKQKIFQFVRKTKTVRKNGKKVKVKVKTKTRTRIKFAGKASDKSGILKVILSVEKTANAKKKTVATGSQSTSSTKKCRWLDAKKGLKKTACSKPILIVVKFKNGSWTYNVKKSIKLSTGSYRAIVYGLDKLGSFGNSAPKAKRNIKFTIR